MSDPHPDSTIEHQLEANHDSPPDAQDDDARSDIEQAVEARSDAIENGDGGHEPDALSDAGMPDGVGGTAGVTKNQGDDAQ